MQVMDRPTVERKTRELWSRDTLPPELQWIEKLTPSHYRLFIGELYDAVKQARFDDDWEPVFELLEDWYATAQVDSSPELAEYLLSDREGKEFQEVDIEKLRR